MMDEMIRKINKYPNGTILMIKWNDGTSLKGKIDTIYETDNGQEPESSEYKEFYVCLIMVLEIFKKTNKINDIEENSLIEISMQNTPAEITLENGLVIWKI